MWVTLRCPVCVLRGESFPFEVSGRGTCRVCKAYLIHHWWRRTLTIETGTRAYQWRADPEGTATVLMRDFEGELVEHRGRWQRIGAGVHTKPDGRVRHWKPGDDLRTEPRWNRG